jgi:hypothetical protein
MPEFPSMPRHERRKLIKWLGANYPHHLKMMAGLEIPETLIDQMVDYGKVLGPTRFNFLRERWQDYSVLHFCFKQQVDANAFQTRFRNIWPRMSAAFWHLIVRSWRTSPE